MRRGGRQLPPGGGRGRGEIQWPQHRERSRDGGHCPSEPIPSLVPEDREAEFVIKDLRKNDSAALF